MEAQGCPCLEQHPKKSPTGLEKQHILSNVPHQPDDACHHAMKAITLPFPVAPFPHILLVCSSVLSLIEWMLPIAFLLPLPAMFIIVESAATKPFVWQVHATLWPHAHTAAQHKGIQGSSPLLGGWLCLREVTNVLVCIQSRPGEDPDPDTLEPSR